jgi:hypothetical protein
MHETYEHVLFPIDLFSLTGYINPDWKMNVIKLAHCSHGDQSCDILLRCQGDQL